MNWDNKADTHGAIRVAILLASLVLSSIARAEIDWSDGPFDDLKTKVTNVQTNVNTIQTKVVGNISTVADELKKQVDILQSKGILLKDGAEQLLDWLNANIDAYQSFAGQPRCGSGSPCAGFRDDLTGFLHDFSDLSDKFPIIERAGFKDSPLLTRAIEHWPPVLLFPLYQAMSHSSAWRELPEQLGGIYDEIGDPDVFAFDLIPASASFDNSTYNYTYTYNANAINGSSSSSQTPTERFCSNKADRLDSQIDSVRLNRIKVGVSGLATVMNIIGEVQPKDQNFSVLGEGLSVPVPNFFKMLVHATTWIREAVNAYRENIAICINLRETRLAEEQRLEDNIAHCVMLTDYLLDSGFGKARALVENRIDWFDSLGISVDKSVNSLATADSQWTRGHRNEAYNALCDAYKKIGS